eukprot:s23_g69.t1
MFLTLSLSQSKKIIVCNKLIVCARAAEYDALDLFVDYACASSVRVGPLIAAHKQVFGEVLCKLRRVGSDELRTSPSSKAC